MFVDRQQFMSADVSVLEPEIVIGKRPVPEPTFWEKLTGALPALGASYAAIQQQKMQNEMLRLQMERAKAGLPPLDMNLYAPAPLRASLGVGLDNRSMIFAGLIGAALLGALVLTRKGRR